ncbi:MAG: hypothetical protein QXN37_01015 [Candidatus Anstonellaceae archaeon]
MFDFSNYWLFLLLLAFGYVVFNNFAQQNVGGKGRLFSLQKEMQETQKKMIEASKARREKEYQELSSKYLEQTMELFKIQLKLAIVILIPFFFLISFVFPAIEPTGDDDIYIQLSDDGSAESCDQAANDGIYSGCIVLSENAKRGAWVIDVILKSAQNESLARFQHPIFYEGGSMKDIWLHNTSQSGVLDALLGKTAYAINITTNSKEYSSGQQVKVYATVVPNPPKDARLEAVFNSGTFFYIDLPAPLPLLNIRRIIGSTGVFIFFAFVLGLSLSLGKAFYTWASKKIHK